MNTSNLAILLTRDGTIQTYNLWFLGGIVGAIGLAHILGDSLGEKLRTGFFLSCTWIVIYWPIMIFGGIFGEVAESYEQKLEQNNTSVQSPAPSSGNYTHTISNETDLN